MIRVISESIKVIKRFGFKNFHSFKDGAEVNFMFDGNVPSDIRNGRDFTTVLGIKGANGSGKTNLIRALEFFKNFCTDYTNKNLGDNLDISSFFNSNEPTEFYVEFISNGQHYFYEVEVTSTSVISETLYRKVNKFTKLFVRTKNELSYATKELSILKSITLSSNKSVISLVSQLKLVSELTPIKDTHDIFYKLFTNVTKNGYIDFKFSLAVSSQEFYTNKSLLQLLKKIINITDNGISDIEIRKKLDDETGDESYYPVFIHENENIKHELLFNQESSGSKTIYQKLYLYWLTLNAGGILALDEFDVHLHALILPYIIEWFASPSNVRDAQFIFTAHNTEIMDYLKKYRTILVNKSDNESYCYRLDEIEGSIIRNDRPISPLYLDGKIGGTPVIGNIMNNRERSGNKNEELC